MSRHISDETKLKERRCSGTGADYTAWTRAQEFNSHGLCCVVQDWKTGRSVHLFSRAEHDAYLILRFNDRVEDIREQYALRLRRCDDPDDLYLEPLLDEIGETYAMEYDCTMEIAEAYGFRHPQNRFGYCRMTTDLLLTMNSGDYRHIAVSIKGSRDLSRRDKEKLLIEKTFWMRRRIPWILVFKDEISTITADNIRLAVKFYRKEDIRIPTDILYHLVATKKFCPELDKAVFDRKTLLKLFRERAVYDRPGAVPSLFIGADNEADRILGCGNNRSECLQKGGNS